MSVAPKLLFLSQGLPYPPDSGVSIRTFHVLRVLSRHFEITALCFYRTRMQGSRRKVEDSVKALRQFCRIEAFPIPQEHSRLRLVADHARSLLGGRAYTAYTYRSADYRRRLRHLLRQHRFDVVHVDSLDLCDFLPEVSLLPTICVHHNIESKLLRRRAAHERSRWKRAYLEHQAGLVEREESRWAGRVAWNVTVSEADRRDLERLVPEANSIVVPNGVDVDEFRPAPGAGDSIVYLGGTEWLPNRDALEYFCASILPLLRTAEGASLPVRWIGRASAQEQRHYLERYGVELTGYVDDVRRYVHDAACVIIPLRIGGGTRLKITTAWALGKAVVSTSIGCEGLAARDGENIVIRDDPGAFAAAVLEVVRDRPLRHRLEAGARSTATRIYDWDVITREMIEEYLGVAGHRAARVG